MPNPLDPEEVVRLYLPRPAGEGLSLKGICDRLHADRQRVQRILDDRKVPRKRVGRQPISEEEWDRRRKVARKCTSWTQVRRELGLEPWQVSPANWKKHGVKLKGEA